MRRVWRGLFLGLVLMPLGEASAQQCQTTGTNQTCTNSVFLSGGAVGLFDSALATVSNTGTIFGALGIRADSADVTNAGTISGNGNAAIVATNSANVANSGGIYGGLYGVFATTANVTNTGTISGSTGGVVAFVPHVTNSGSISGGAYGIEAFDTAIVTNSGTIAGSVQGIYAFNAASVTNSGTISGGFQYGIFGGNSANIVNSGTISGSQTGIAAVTANVTNSGTISGATQSGMVVTTLSVTNSGTISGGSVGIQAATGNVTNSGTISGRVLGMRASTTADVTNSGTIMGGFAALFFTGNADTLTLLPGSRIIGAIRLGGGDTVNFRGGNNNLTFNTLAGATVTGTNPFAVSGNQAASVDSTPFAANWRTLADFTRAASDAVPVFSGGGVPDAGMPLAFAGTEGPSRIEDAFASLPGLSAYSGEAMVFKAPTQTYADGTTVWARGFAGQRIQQQDGVLLRNASVFYGGMIGADFAFRPDLRYGFYLGGGKTTTSIDLNQDGSNSDLVFGGVYARHDFGASFVHAAVQAGSSRNAITRTINNNLVAGGLETAGAAFDGWYVSPEATIGHRLALGQLAGASYTLTPSLRIRYLYGSYDGYTETGTTAPLTVGGQTVSTLEERGEVKLTRTVQFSPNDMLSTSVSAGVLGTQRVGGNTINAVLLGQAMPFATPGQSSVWGGFGGVGMEWRSRNVTLFSAAEYLAFTDNANVVSGRAGIRVAF